MDAAGFRKAVLFAASEGGPASIVFAATRPERTQALILTGTFAYSFADDWDDLERDPTELRARLVRTLGEDYAPSAKQLAGWQPSVTWSSARARVSRTAAASSCVACQACGNCWRSTVTDRCRDPPIRNWFRCRPPALVPRCGGRTALWP
jgi:pimeloyl-ACP methyl ester carboxylesterase